MKINKLILENFSNIETAMNARRIEIDFRDAKNKIILLIGPNGSGKTSILSLLTPFATVGGLDVRNSSNLIINGKAGYKEIEIQEGDNIYLIKHFYTPKKPDGHSVKSYIMKNGTELNLNGNVTSFKEWVKEELHVEMDYLKLIRLGSNVTSMIDLTETERKTFMNKLLSDADIFLTFFKKVNTDLRQLKEMISHAVDKQNRLGVISIDDINEDIKEYEYQTSMKLDEYNKISGEISIAQQKINEIEDTHLLKIKITDLQKKIKKMNDILQRKDYESSDPNFYITKINELEKECIQLETKKSSQIALINFYLTKLDEMNNDYHSLQIQFEKEKESDTEIKSLQSQINNIDENINNILITLDIDKPSISKTEIDEFVVFLKNIQQQLDRTYEFGKHAVKKVILLMKNNKNVLSYIDRQYSSIEMSDTTEILFQRLKKKFSFTEKDIPTDCVNDMCIARRAYVEISNIINGGSEDEKIDTVTLQSMENVYNNLTHIFSDFGLYKDIIGKLPEDIRKDFLLNNIYDKIASCDMIYDDKKMNHLLSVVTEYYNIEVMEEQKHSLKNILKSFKKLSNLSYIESQLTNIEIDIDTYNKNIKSLKQEIFKDDETISDNKRTLETYNDLKETFSKYDELSAELSDLQIKWNIYVENSKILKDDSIILQKIKLEMSYLQEKIQNKKTTLTQYKDLQKDLNNYNRIFDEMTLIKESLSSNKGIPLRYVKSYLGNTEEITNELLDIAFNGNIYIDKFKITQSEFTIPFYNKGKLLRDVKLASQGETSFISIALAFALSSQTMQKYNIMLLDEIDSTLDIRFKEKFIKILENQIDRINAEQCFFITHGNMFSSYPVDVLSLGKDSNEYKGTIKIIKK